MQMHRRLQRRAVNVLQQPHRAQHLLGGSGYFGIEECRSERDCAAAETDVQFRGALGRKPNGDGISTGLNVPGLRVGGRGSANSGGYDGARRSWQRRI